MGTGLTGHPTNNIEREVRHAAREMSLQDYEAKKIIPRYSKQYRTMEIPSKRAGLSTDAASERELFAGGRVLRMKRAIIAFKLYGTGP